MNKSLFHGASFFIFTEVYFWFVKSSESSKWFSNIYFQKMTECATQMETFWIFQTLIMWWAAALSSYI